MSAFPAAWAFHCCLFLPVLLQAAGFTVSPLMSKYVKLAGGEESQESLVTLVLKADLGGLVSGGGPGTRWAWHSCCCRGCITAMCP